MPSINQIPVVVGLAAIAVLAGVSHVGWRATAQTQSAGSQTGQRQGGATTTLVDNDHVRVLRSKWAAGDNDGAVHNSATDLILVQITPGDVEQQMGEQKTTVHAEVGKTWFLPKEIPHRFANAGKEPYEFIAIILKK
jgi:quercetin dioxygenase-like cupin family protein